MSSKPQSNFFSVNIIPNITSVYRWEGKIENSQEHLLIIKSTQEKFQEIQKEWKENHSYDVPELIQIPVIIFISSSKSKSKIYKIQGGSKEYLEWIFKSVTF